MAKRGRKPIPPEDKLINRRKWNGTVPFARQPVFGDPHKPETIATDPIASQAWDDMVKHLHDRSILSPADWGILAVYCDAYSRLVRARDALKPVGGKPVALTCPSTVGGAMKINPLMTIVSMAGHDLVCAAKQLGATPAARTRLAVAVAGKPTDALEDFLEA
jgi:P27 family predicted phage terminase small subunit